MTWRVVVFGQVDFPLDDTPAFAFHSEPDPSAVATWCQNPELFALVLDASQDIQQVKSLCPSSVHILAVTPNNSGARHAALESGADDLLTAPLDPIELMHTLNNLPMPNRAVFQEAGDYDVLGHDLKGPLGTVISSLDLIASMLAGQEKLQGLVLDSLQTARREHMLLENMIDYLRVQDDNMRLELAVTPVMPIIKEFVDKATSLAQRRHVQVSVETSGDIPHVYADHRCLRRILDALFDNAMKFCTRGCEFKVKIQTNGQHLDLQLIDNGRPIAPQYQQLIFGQRQQLAMRLDGSRASVAANLPFARALARLMGGDLQAKSEDGWTIFSLTVPVADE